MYAMTVMDDRSFRWREVPDPVAGNGELLVEIHAAALNRADLLQRAGKYPPPPGWPEWPGLEVSGVVIDAPGCRRWKPGDRVCALLGGGGYAERVVVPEAQALPVPEGVSMVEAAALPEAFATSWLNLRCEAGLRAGETALIHAGASGLGIAAIQTAKLLEARVITTVGTGEKAEVVRRFGADVVCNRRKEDPDQLFRDHAVDVVLDCVGGEALGRQLGMLAPGGRWVLIATLGGEFAGIPLRPILKRGIRLIGSTLRSRSPEEKGRILAELEREVWPKFAAGAVRPLVYREFPIGEVEAAHAVLERHENAGKVVLRIR